MSIFKNINECLPPTAFLLAFGALSVLASQYWIYHEHCLPSKARDGVIYDMGHEWLPNVGKFGPLHEIFGSHNIFDLIPLIPFGYLMLTGGWRDWKSFLWIFSFIFLIRSLTTAVTVLPPLDKENPNVRTRCSNLLALGGSHDYIFSGHTAVMLLSIIFILARSSKAKNSNNNNNTRAQKWFWGLYAIVGSLFIAASQNHYTVDVVLAWVITYLLFHYFNGKGTCRNPAGLGPLATTKK